jgi:hypothetical protein
MNSINTGNTGNAIQQTQSAMGSLKLANDRLKDVLNLMKEHQKELPWHMK